MGDAGAERAVLGALGIDDPLVVIGGVGEAVDPLLLDLDPIGDSQIPALGGDQFLGAGKTMVIPASLKRAAS